MDAVDRRWAECRDSLHHGVYLQPWECNKVGSPLSFHAEQPGGIRFYM
jgi:hypothetical protein